MKEPIISREDAEVLHQRINNFIARLEGEGFDSAHIGAQMIGAGLALNTEKYGKESSLRIIGELMRAVDRQSAANEMLKQ
jgi:hypothetical protein